MCTTSVSYYILVLVVFPTIRKNIRCNATILPESSTSPLIAIPGQTKDKKGMDDQNTNLPKNCFYEWSLKFWKLRKWLWQCIELVEFEIVSDPSLANPLLVHCHCHIATVLATGKVEVQSSCSVQHHTVGAQNLPSSKEKFSTIVPQR